MRRILTTLMILLLVIVAGLAALIVLVDPNDFRTYMVHKVAERSGYQLELDGPLRWHVWPQLSILSGRMTLTAPGAAKPIIRADNMRLDVALIPLISHQLQIRQIMLKGAVIQLTPESRASVQQKVPVVPHDRLLPQIFDGSRWSYDVQRLQLVDSILFVQLQEDKQLTVRHIDLQMEQDEKHHASVDFSGQINRDQRDLTLAFSAQIEGEDYPRSFKADISRLSWQLTAAGLPDKGIRGEGNARMSWQGDKKSLRVDDFNLTANDSAMAGKFTVMLAAYPDWQLDLHAEKLNFDNLLLQNDIPAGASSAPSAPGNLLSGQSRPVIAHRDDDNDNLWREFNGHMRLTADQLQWRGMTLSQVKSDLSNQQGLVTVNQLQGELSGGQLSLPGILDLRGDTPQAVFQPELKRVEIATLLKAFNYALSVSGKLSLSGKFSGENIDADTFRRHWQGDAQIQLQDTRVEGLNIQQLVQQAMMRSNNHLQAEENDDNATQLNALSGRLQLAAGKVTLDNLQGHSALLTLSGQGDVNLQQQVCDMHFDLQILDGWKGDSKLIAALKQTTIPLRIYGKWHQLSYHLQVDQLLRKQLQNEVRQRVNDWMTRNKRLQQSTEVH
ncbi:outer membrane assembly protein AsmA [Enterobacteriaceae bacterium ESL0689]|nr:outer membrane assembly protein AsmA [Enterobacteriaceae bacterium ESL0689]